MDEKEYMDPRGQWRESRRGGWRDPMGGVVFGLMLVWLGVCFYLKQTGRIPTDIWWAYLLVGFGGLWFLGGIVRLFVPRWRHGVLGGLIPGVVVGAVGLMFILGSWQYWPLILVAVGVIVVIAVIVRAVLVNRKET